MVGFQYRFYNFLMLQKILKEIAFTAMLKAFFPFHIIYRINLKTYYKTIENVPIETTGVASIAKPEPDSIDGNGTPVVANVSRARCGYCAIFTCHQF